MGEKLAYFLTRNDQVVNEEVYEFECRWSDSFHFRSPLRPIAYKKSELFSEKRTHYCVSKNVDKSLKK